jgi:hypothetical protein
MELHLFEEQPIMFVITSIEFERKLYLLVTISSQMDSKYSMEICETADFQLTSVSDFHTNGTVSNRVVQVVLHPKANAYPCSTLVEKCRYAILPHVS